MIEVSAVCYADNSDVLDALELLDEGDTGSGGSVAGGSAFPRRGRGDRLEGSNDQAPKVPAPPRHQPRSDEQPSAHSSAEAQDTRHVRSGQQAVAPEERPDQHRSDAQGRSHRADAGSKGHEHSDQGRGHQQYMRPSQRKESVEPTRERTNPPESTASPEEQARRSSQALHRRVRRRNLGRGDQDREQ